MKYDDYSIQTARAQARQSASIERGKSPEVMRYTLERGAIRFSERAVQVKAMTQALKQGMGTQAVMTNGPRSMD